MYKISHKNKKSKLAASIVIITVSLSVFVIVIASVVSNGFRQEVQRKTYELLDFGHIRSSMSFLGGSTELSAQEVSEFEDIVGEGLEGVVQGFVVVQSGYNVLSSVVCGVAEVGVGEVVLSRTAMERLGVESGGRVDVISMVDGVLRYESLLVGDGYSSGIVDMEEGLMFISVVDARRFCGLGEGYSYYRLRGEVDMSGAWEWLEERGLEFEGAEERAVELFGWLRMIDNNMLLVVLIMLVVSVVNIVTSTLIIMLDNTVQLGVLRSLGMSVRGVVLFYVRGVGVYVLRGVLCGVLLGFVVGGVQLYWNVLELDTHSYFVDSVPISFNFLELTIYIVTLWAVGFVSLVVPVRFMAGREVVQLLRYR